MEMSAKAGLGLIAAIGGYITYLEGAIGVPVFIAGLCIIIDIILGIGKAAKAGNLWSRRAWVGGLHKLWYIFAIVLGVTADYLFLWLGNGVITGLDFTMPPIFGAAVALWIIATESISIIENLDELTGGKMPAFMKKLFQTMQTQIEQQTEAKTGDTQQGGDATK